LLADAVLVVNAGSSSVKFQIFGLLEHEDPPRLIRGQVDGIGTRPRLRAEGRDGHRSSTDPTHPTKSTMFLLRLWPRQSGCGRARPWNRSPSVIAWCTAVRNTTGPLLSTRTCWRAWNDTASLAPLHQPNNLAPIRSLLTLRPELVQVACFDTAFHRTHNALADRYAIPEHFYR